MIPWLTSGSAPRSVVDGPGVRNVDLGVFRSINLKGRSALQFRLEATNVFNMVNLSNPGTNFGAAANTDAWLQQVAGVAVASSDGEIEPGECPGVWSALSRNSRIQTVW